MKGVMSLTKNEMFKTRKQASFLVILIIAMVLIILIPIFFSVISSVNSWGSVNMEERMKRYQEYMEMYPQEKMYYQSAYEMLKFYHDNDIDSSDWRYETLSDTYTVAIQKVILLEYLHENGYPDEASSKENYIYIDDYMIFQFADTEVIEQYFEMPQPETIMPGDYETDNEIYYYNYSLKPNVNYNEAMKNIVASIDWDKTLPAAKQQVSDLEQTILNNDTKAIHQQNLDTRRENLDGLIAQKSELQKALEAMPDSENLKEQIASCEKNIAALKETIPFFEYAYEHNILLSRTDWRYNAVNQAENLIQNRQSHKTVSEEEFYNEYLSHMHMSYSAYKDLQNKKLSLLNESISVLKYGLEHDIAPEGTVNKSTKGVWNDSISFSMFVFIIFGILLGGTIVSNEFSSGTIRLLLIRPKKRYKILLSKLFCLLFYLLGLLLFAFIVQFIVSAICCLGTDAFSPDLWVIGGDIVRIPAVLSVLFKALVNLVPALFYSCLAFMCSAVITKSIFALAVPMLTYIGSLISSLIVTSIFPTSVFSYTIFAQADLSKYIGNPYLSSDILMMDTGVPQISLGVALIILGVHIAVALTAAFAVFSKKQIKS